MLQSLPWGDAPAPWENENRVTIDPELKQVYEARISIYLEPHKIGNIQSIYNFPIQNNFNLVDIRQHLNVIYNTQTQSLKLNVTFGLILRSVGEMMKEDIELGFVTKMTIYLVEICILVRVHLERAVDRMKHMDITNYLMQQ